MEELHLTLFLMTIGNRSAISKIVHVFGIPFDAYTVRIIEELRINLKILTIVYSLNVSDGVIFVQTSSNQLTCYLTYSLSREDIAQICFFIRINFNVPWILLTINYCDNPVNDDVVITPPCLVANSET